MPRPCKRRRVCAMPGCARYGPLAKEESGERVTMTVDEYEAIRLIDLEGLTQEQCAARMEVARATVQGIYAEARRKVAQSLVEQKELRIEGGEYELCPGGGRCGRRCGRKMKGEGER